MDPVHKLLETTLIGTPIPVPIEVRVHEISFDPLADKFWIKWKAACPETGGSDFDEPPEGERKRYLLGELHLSRDIFIGDNRDRIASLRELIAEATARDVAEFMVIGANYCKENGK